MFEDIIDKVTGAFNDFIFSIEQVHQTWGIDPYVTVGLAIVTLIFILIMAFMIKWAPQQYTVGIVLIILKVTAIMWLVYFLSIVLNRYIG